MKPTIVLTRARGAGGARAQRDVGAHCVEGLVGCVRRVGGVGNAPAAGPGVVGRARGGVAAEVLAVVPGGASVAVHVGGIGDDGAAEGDGTELLEQADVLELRARGPSAPRNCPLQSIIWDGPAAPCRLTRHQAAHARASLQWSRCVPVDEGVQGLCRLGSPFCWFGGTDENRRLEVPGIKCTKKKKGFQA